MNVGVIVQVDGNQIGVLQENGQVVNVDSRQLTTPRNNPKLGNAADTNGQAISVGDRIRESVYPHREGAVLYIYRQYVFARGSGILLAQGGVFVQQAADVVNLTPKKHPAQENISSGPGSAHSGFRGGDFKRGGHKDPLISQTVSIRLGPHKGMMGIVKECQDNQVRVELHTNGRIIPFTKEALVVKL